MAKGQTNNPQKQTANDSSNPVSQTAKEMQTSGMSTKDILKTLFHTSLQAKHGDIAIPDAAVSKMIIEDSEIQHMRDDITNSQDRNEAVMNKYGDTGQTIQKITAKDDTAFSSDFADEFNGGIQRTNGRSEELWNLEQKAEQRVESGLASRDELLQAFSKGEVSSSALLEKLSDKLDDTKNSATQTSQQADAIASAQEKELPLIDRLSQEATAIGFAKRVLKAPGLGDSDYTAGPTESTSSEGPSQDSGGSGIAPS